MLRKCLPLITFAFSLSINHNAIAQTATPTTMQISASSTTGVQPVAPGLDVGIESPELSPALNGDVDSDTSSDSGGAVVNRSLPGQPAIGPSVPSSKKAKSNPILKASFDGIFHRQQRLANGGNQFSVEPPDQGLCAGNGFVLEVVNDVLNVFDSSGTPQLSFPVDLNTFYGYIPAIVRSTSTFGPSITDPSCYFDVDTQRWFVVVLTLEVVPTGPFAGFLTGANHLDLAVSTTSNPLGSYVIYRIPTEDDGTQGQPNHNCPFCFGDYPHIGADANGFYITTNEFSLAGGPFHGSQIYAISKQALAANASSIAVAHFDTADAALRLDGNQGFTVWPATSPGGIYSSANGGTEYLLSSVAVFNGSQTDTRLRLWTLSNTQSLNSSPALTLSTAVVNVETYARPPKAEQKAGDFPLGQCLNIAACATNIILGFPDPFAPNVEYKLDSNDSRMQQVVYANGKLWAALDTALLVNNVNKAGVAWFVINPSTPKVVKQGYIGVTDTNLVYPAVGVTSSGRGVIAFTLAGTNDFPGAAYASLDALAGAGPVTSAQAGAGPADGFSGYPIFNFPNPNRPRWGDYGATTADGNSLWVATEFISQTCTLTQYLTSPIGSCGGTRSSLANWATRITKLTP
jgi:hypothetical protein